MANRAHRSTARLKPKHIHKREHKHYWPYIPVLVMTIAIFAMSLLQPLGRGGVLAYATEMSSSGLLSATNAERKENGKANLGINSALSNAAQAKANDMVKRDYWSHNTPDGDEPWVFIEATGYDYKKAGENLAYGFSTSSSTVTGWMNSPSHRANMLDNSFTQVGFGYANSPDFNDAGKQTVVVAMYGQPQVQGAASQPAPPAPSPAPLPVPSPSPTPVAQAKPPKKKTAEPVKPPVATTSNVPFTSDQPGLEPVSRAVTRLGTSRFGDLGWLVFAVGLFTGVALTGLLVKHAVGLRHVLRNSERFILHHPMLDLVLVSLVLVGTFLMQTSGYVM